MPNIRHHTTHFTKEQLEGIDPTRIPQHVAFLPDGNRRWAREQEMRVQEGHQQGGNTIIDITVSAKEIGIKALTFFVFSTENWSRPQEEVNGLMWLLEVFLNEQLPYMLEEGIRFHTIGIPHRLPDVIQNTINRTKEATKNCTKVDLIFALDYGSKDEICRAAQAIAEDFKNGAITSKEDINETLFAKYLDTAPFGDPDLWIRTGGEFRVSNYLIWQLAYAELYYLPLYWPDFRPCHLLEAVVNFQSRNRRWGK